MQKLRILFKIAVKYWLNAFFLKVHYVVLGVKT